MTYDEALSWLYSTQTFGIKLGLQNPTRLLREYLAFPSHRTQVIQVAGTNGKGSTCAFLDSLARSRGLRSGLFTSPHLVTYRERIQINGQLITEETVARHLTELKELVQTWETHPTFFELTLALAMRHFRDHDCELIILEVGMGGRFDATSAVPSNVNLLTPIALDHQQWLGETLSEIAFEKASICRAGTPLLSAPQDPEAVKTIAETANQTRASLEWINEPLLGYPLGIPGAHQAYNAALALHGLHAAGYDLSYDAVRDGLSKAHHPGRFEIVPHEDQTLILDIAHNPHAITSLLKALKERYPKQKPTLIFGAADSKDIATLLEHLSSQVSDIHFVPINSSRSTSPEKLAALLPAAAPPAHLHPSLADALQDLAHQSLILVTGSAFLVGETKALLQGQAHQSSAQ